MAHGREKVEWNRTAKLCSVLVNLWSGEKTKPADFHPFEKGDRTSRPGVGFRKEGLSIAEAVEAIQKMETGKC